MKYELFWESENGQGSMPGGKYETLGVAVQGANVWLEDILLPEVCGGGDDGEENAKGILAGRFVIIDTETEDKIEVFPVRDALGTLQKYQYPYAAA